MPLIEDEGNTILSSSQNAEASTSYQELIRFDETPPTDYTIGETLEAAIQVDSITAGLYNSFTSPLLDEANTVEEGYNVFNDIEGYENYADSFVGVRNANRATLIKEKINNELAAKQVLNNSGASGIVSSIAVGVLDPMSLALNAVGGVGFIKTGASVGKAALGTAAVTGTTAALEEGLLQSTQVTRTAEESIINIGAAALLGGAIGAGGQKFVNSRFNGSEGTTAFTDTADELVDNIEDSNVSTSMPFTEGTAENPRYNSVKSTIVNIDDDEIATNLVGDAVRKLTSWTTPISRAMESPSSIVKRLTVSMAENAYITKGNERGIASVQAIETTIKMRTESLNYQTVTELRDGFKTSSILDEDLFNEEVGKAMRRGDDHSDAGVDATAKKLRKVLDEIKDDYIKLGVFDEDITPEGALSYFTRVYNPTTINGRYNEFVDVISKHLYVGHTDSVQRFSERYSKVSGKIVPLDTIRKDITTFLDGNDVKVDELVSTYNGLTNGKVTDVDSLSRHLLDEVDDNQNLKSFFGDVDVTPANVTRFLRDTLKEVDEVSVKLRAERQVAYDGKQAISEVEAKEIAQRIAETVQGNGGSFDLASLPDSVVGKSPMIKERTLGFIPDTELEPFLVNDASWVLSKNINKTISEIEMTKAYGNTNMEKQIKEIEDDYFRMIQEAPTDKARTKLRESQRRDVRDITVMRDRLNGKDGKSLDPYSKVTRTTKAILTVNYMRMLGGVAISSIPDIAKNIMHNGWGESWGTLSNVLSKEGREFSKLSKAQLKDISIGLETTLATRANSMADINEQVFNGTKAEKLLEKGSNKFGNITFLNQWNDFMKTWVSATSSNKIVNDSLTLFNKGTLSKQKKAQLNALGIDEAMSKRIAKQFDTHGETYGNSAKQRLANTDAWTDREAVRIFNTAVKKEADTAVVSSGIGDKPILATNDVFFKLMFQFKSFMLAANNRTLVAGLSRKDSAFYSSMMFMVGMGGITYYLKELVNGKSPDQIDTTPLKLITEGIDRSGAIPMFGEVINTGVLLGGGAGTSRYQQRNALGNIFGPTFSGIEDVSKVTGDIISGEPRKGLGSNSMRNLIPYQNVWYLRSLMRNTPLGETIQEGIQDDAYKPYTPKALSKSVDNVAENLQ